VSYLEVTVVTPFAFGSLRARLSPRPWGGNAHAEATVVTPFAFGSLRARLSPRLH